MTSWPVLRMEADGDLVAQSFRWERRWQPRGEDLGSARFQAIDGGVFAIHIIANFGSSHGRAHCGGGDGWNACRCEDQSRSMKLPTFPPGRLGCNTHQ